MHKMRLRISQEAVYSWLLIITISRPAVGFVLRKVLSLVGLSFIYSYVLAAIMLIPVFIIFVKTFNHSRNQIQFLGIYLVFVLYFFINLVIHPSYEMYYFRDVFGIDEVFFGITRGSIWCLLAFVSAKDPQKVMRALRIAAYIMFLYSIYELIQARRVGYWETYNARGVMTQYNYSLTYGYQVIFCTIVFLYYYFNKKSIIDLTCSIISLVFVIMEGSRGSLICLFMFVLLYSLICVNKLKPMTKILLGIGALGIYFLISSNWDALVEWFLHSIMKTNINSRTISMLLNGNITSDQNRLVIYDLCWNSIKNQGFFGMGAFGNRTVIAPQFYWGYPHNIFIELVMDYGWFIAIILSIIIICSCIRMFKYAEGDRLFVFIILLSMTMRLFMSSSYWTDGFFWGFLGWMYASFQNISYNKRIRNTISSRTMES